MSEWGNPAADMSCHLQVNTWPAREVPGELKRAWPKEKENNSDSLSSGERKGRSTKPCEGPGEEGRGPGEERGCGEAMRRQAEEGESPVTEIQGEGPMGS